MKKLIASLVVIFSCTTISFSQNGIISENFESRSEGENLLLKSPENFTTWGALTKWTVTVSEAEGNSKSNKFASSSNNKMVSFVRNVKLKEGQTYLFKVATKIMGEETPSKRSHSIKVTSGKKGDMKIYGEKKIDKPALDTWQSSGIEFTVESGLTNVSLQVYRFQSGGILNVDDFVLIKQ
jgi:hypothetical protein